MSILGLKIRTEHTDFNIDIDQDVPLDKVTALFGASGAGKTTILRIIAGFERGAGRITFDGEVWEDGQKFVPPHRRRVATVFQQPGLFTHLDVAGNLSYAARRSGQMSALADMVKRFDLAPLLARNPGTLSGGEAQRVALARALLTRPKLILMDEPLSALDQGRRDEILPYIEQLQNNSNTPILYVSHAIAEVARLATQVLTISGGRVTGFGPTEVMLGRHTSISSADERGSLIVAKVKGMTADGLCELAFDGGQLLTPEPMGEPGKTVRLFIRARDVMIAKTPPDGISALNILGAQITAITRIGPASADVTLSCGGSTLQARITQRSVAALGLAAGDACYAIVKTVALARDNPDLSVK
ncbi:MAG: molybdenum ABC transporter ATP-binding protein [Albidovulum sp.]